MKMATEKSMIQAMIQVSNEATIAAIMIVREANDPVNNARPYIQQLDQVAQP